MIIVAMKVSCHCGVVNVFYVKCVNLESISDSVFCLSYIFNMAPVTKQYIKLLLWQVPCVIML